MTVQVTIDNLIKFKSQVNAISKTQVSVMDLIIKAASVACTKVPETNSSWQGDFIRRYKNVSIGVGFKTEHGFLTPVIHNANQKGIEQIAKEMRSLGEKAKKNELTMNDTNGATFTIANLGEFNVNSYVPIVNAPQACILGVGAAEKGIVLDEKAASKENAYK